MRLEQSRIQPGGARANKHTKETWSSSVLQQQDREDVLSEPCFIAGSVFLRPHFAVVPGAAITVDRCPRRKIMAALHAFLRWLTAVLAGLTAVHAMCPNWCSQRGICTSPAQGGYCDCDMGYFGDDCGKSESLKLYCGWSSLAVC